MVLRRWYAFYALSVLLALLVEAAAFRRSPAPVLGYLCGMGFPLLFFLQTFVSQRLLSDYAAQYAAYDLGLGVDFRMLFRYYGIWLLLAALALGVWLALRREDRRKGVFLLLEPSVCFFLFVQVQSHGQQHLLLYVPALACLLILGFDRLADRGRLRALAVAAAVVPTAVSPALPRTQGSVIQDYPLFMPLPTFSYAPPVREDAWEVVGPAAAAGRIRRGGEAGGAAGLLFYPQRLPAALCGGLFERRRVSDVDRSYLATLSEVDSRDGLSGALYACDILAVADPHPAPPGAGEPAGHLGPRPTAYWRGRPSRGPTGGWRRPIPWRATALRSTSLKKSGSQPRKKCRPWPSWSTRPTRICTSIRDNKPPPRRSDFERRGGGIVVERDYLMAMASTSSRRRAENASRSMAPRSSPVRCRTETVPFSLSRSPTTSI